MTKANYSFEKKLSLLPEGRFNQNKPKAPSSQKNPTLLFPQLRAEESIRELGNDDLSTLEENPQAIMDQFDYGVALLSTKKIFGQRVRESVNRIASSEASHHVYGLRRSGKTSVLRGAQECLDYNLVSSLSKHAEARVPVYLSMQGLDTEETLEGFVVSEAERQIETTLKQQHVELSNFGRFSSLKDLLRNLAQRNIHITFLLDEMSKATTGEREEEAGNFFSKLRALEQDRDLKLSLAVSSGSRLEVRTKPIYGSDFGNILQALDVPLLTNSDTREMVCVLLAKVLGKLVAPTRVFTDVLNDATGGYPYLINGLINSMAQYERLDLLKSHDRGSNSRNDLKADK